MSEYENKEKPIKKNRPSSRELINRSILDYEVNDTVADLPDYSSYEVRSTDEILKSLRASNSLEDKESKLEDDNNSDASDSIASSNEESEEEYDDDYDDSTEIDDYDDSAEIEDYDDSTDIDEEYDGEELEEYDGEELEDYDDSELEDYDDSEELDGLSLDTLTRDINEEGELSDDFIPDGDALGEISKPKEIKKEVSKTSITALIIGLIIPIVGLILATSGINNAKKGKEGYLIPILALIVSIIGFIIQFLF